MLANVTSGALIGIDAYPVEVEVDIAQGLPQFSTVGLPEGAVKESKDRVKSAIKNSGYDFPARRITINLAPADIRNRNGRAILRTHHDRDVQTLKLPRSPHRTDW